MRRYASAVRPGHVLIVVAGTYFVTQLLIIQPERFFGWDEAIYLAEVYPDRPSIEWGPHRARGVTFLVAPVAALAPEAEAVRIYMAAATALLLLLAYASWLPSIGWGAAWGGMAFAFSWMPLVQGSEVLPNIPAALCAVGLTGAFLGRVMGGRRLWSAAAVVMFGCALALLRPSETVPLATVLVMGGAYWSLAGRPSSASLSHGHLLADLVLLGAGMALGWGHWVVEAVTKFDGPMRRFSAAAAVLPGSPDSVLSMLWTYIQTVDGPLAYPGQAGLTPIGVVWMAFFLTGCVFALIDGKAARFLAATVLVAAIALLAGYLMYDWIEVRFLAPAWALVSIAVGLGFSRLVHVVRPNRAATASAASLVAVAVVLMPWHIGIAQDLSAYLSEMAQSDREVAEAIRALTGSPPCAVYADYGTPQLEFASGCEGTFISGAGPEAPPGLQDSRSAAGGVVVALRQEPPAESFLEGWKEKTIPALHGPDWTLYVPPDQAPHRGLRQGGQATRS
ncbi:MAG TPA: hypothetical protein VM287_00550 [Egibacteraceae bacterium]|nr:hypothetical protein [Egibacteraceae bacterium]